MADKKITVTVTSSGITVDQPTVQLKKNQDKAKWVSDTQFGIEMPPGMSSPTAQQQGSQWVCTSQTFGTVETIKYNVTSPGAPTLDPELEVIP